MAMHFPLRRYLPGMGDHFWHNQSDFVVTLEAIALFGTAILLLSLIAPLFLLTIPLLAMGILLDWVVGKHDR